jgi:hypothetical protein
MILSALLHHVAQPNPSKGKNGLDSRGPLGWHVPRKSDRGLMLLQVSQQPFPLQCLLLLLLKISLSICTSICYTA